MRPLAGVRAIECASFVAGPLAGVTLGQLGAEVIRVDPPSGGSDVGRWPLAASGQSLFWAGLNKGKRSVVIDYRNPEGRELLAALATAPGPGAGVLVDNMAGRRRPTYEELRRLRADVIHVHFEGHNGGAPAVDYTVNPATGVAAMTGPDGGGPVNHVLPAWDLLSGMTIATAVVAAVLHRQLTGEGAQVELALADVALAGVGTLGWLAEADAAGIGRPQIGNHLFGAFGSDFETADNHRVMVVALTPGQWRALCAATATAGVFVALERTLGVDLAIEGARHRHREIIAAVLRPWFAERKLAAVAEALDGSRVLWSQYRDLAEVARLARADDTSLATEISQPGIGPMLATDSPLRWDGLRSPAEPAPQLGADTVEVLTGVLDLSEKEINRLRRLGVVDVSPP